MALLSEAFVYLCAAVIAVPIANRLGLGSVLGYLIAGVVIGPVIGIVGSEAADAGAEVVENGQCRAAADSVYHARRVSVMVAQQLYHPAVR